MAISDFPTSGQGGNIPGTPEGMQPQLGQYMQQVQQLYGGQGGIPGAGQMAGSPQALGVRAPSPTGVMPMMPQPMGQPAGQMPMGQMPFGPMGQMPMGGPLGAGPPGMGMPQGMPGGMPQRGMGLLGAPPMAGQQPQQPFGNQMGGAFARPMMR